METKVMTVRGYGRVTPLQMYMLCLGGEVLSWGGTVPPTDRDRLDRMKEAHRLLTQLTGRDFGYDLAAWHHFLLNDDKLSEEYTFDYAWNAVKPRIDELLDDPDRLRLVRLLVEHRDTAGDAPSFYSVISSTTPSVEGRIVVRSALEDAAVVKWI